MLIERCAPRMTRSTAMLLALALLLAMSALLGATSSAGAATVKITKPAQLVFHHGAKADDPGNCSALYFVQWPHVPNVTSATGVIHRTDGTPKTEMAGGPDFHNVSSTVITYTVPAGHDWVALGAGWADGPVANDCSDMSARQRALYDPSPSKIWVELRTEVEAPRIRAIRGAVILNRARVAAIATVACPAGGACTVAAPTTVKVTVNGTRYTVNVIAPKRVLAGKTANVSVRFPAAAATALSGRSVSTAVRITAANYIEAKAASTVSRIVKGRAS